MRDIHHIPLTLELKGHNIINANPRFKRINGSSLGRLVKPERLEILRKIICFISALAPLLEVQNVCFRKKHKIPLNKKDAKNLAKERFIRTWEYTLQRIEAHLYHFEKRKANDYHSFIETIQNRQIPEWLNAIASTERSIIFPDQTQNDRLRKLYRRMRVFNYVPYRSEVGGSIKTRPVTLNHILGDPVFIDSNHSHFVQIADVIGYCLSKYLFHQTVPTKFKSVKIENDLGLHNLFPILEPILCKRAAPEHPLGVKVIEDY